ncbi:hypothetical protein L218DRAFT_974901 [Marasmius fiardii PR-910]|nr:hypothetical protein L218DRAFT_974901 [Marasmius fiardii PR-910]
MPIGRLKEIGMLYKWRLWMINEGGGRWFFGVTVIPFDKNITFNHKATGWSIFIWSFVHTLAHIVNAGPAVTSWDMYARETKRRQNFERFWYTHHLFAVFFINWQLHGMYCMIKPDRLLHCSASTIGVFWRYWLIGGVIWICERVVELQIKKEKKKVRVGQYIFLNCPEILYSQSVIQWHPFMLTSAPEEDYISVHIRVVGDFTTALVKAVGCDFESKEKSRGILGTDTNPPLNRALPRVMVDGPFGSASEDFLNYEVVLLVGAGMGVTPFASILKSIWYRLNNFNHSGKSTRLSKVYFTWVIRDFGAAEWFHSLLHAIEEQDTDRRIEINIHLMAKIKDDDMKRSSSRLFQDVGAKKDSIMNLCSPTHFGRLNWDRVVQSIAGKHPDSDCGVFSCGPNALSSMLHRMSNKYSRPERTRFFFSKENF